MQTTPTHGLLGGKVLYRRERKTPENAPEVREPASPAPLLANATSKAIAICRAGMAELVDAQVSKTCSLGSAGSIPAARTNSLSPETKRQANLGYA